MEILSMKWTSQQKFHTFHRNIIVYFFFYSYHSMFSNFRGFVRIFKEKHKLGNQFQFYFLLPNVVLSNMHFFLLQFQCYWNVFEEMNKHQGYIAELCLQNILHLLVNNYFEYCKNLNWFKELTAHKNFN